MSPSSHASVRLHARVLLLVAALFCVVSWSHEDREPREREMRSERREMRERERGERSERRERGEERAERKVTERKDAREREQRRADSRQKETARTARDSERERTELGTTALDTSIGSTEETEDFAEPEHDRDDSVREATESEHDEARDFESDGSDGEVDDDDKEAGGRTARPAGFDVERDTQGRERIREEILMLGEEAAIAAVRDAGFSIVAARPLTAFPEILARIRVRAGGSLEQSMRELQALAPLASIAPHHLFRPSVDVAAARGTGREQRPAVLAAAHVGIVDTGADTAWATLSGAIVQTRGFADGRYVARTHGTVVAEIVASSGASLAVADVFGVDADNRLIAPAAAIAAAIDWLVGNGVRVINISIEGPDNAVLARVVERALARRVAIVAAAGNGGPVAAPTFPAAYPGVIAVTAVDERGRVYRRANRGDYIAFAARGVRVGTLYRQSTQTFSGTSFAAPIVAAAVANRLQGACPECIEDVLTALKRQARDLGAPGRDPTYGWGELVIPVSLTVRSD